MCLLKTPSTMPMEQPMPRTTHGDQPVMLNNLLFKQTNMQIEPNKMPTMQNKVQTQPI